MVTFGMAVTGKWDNESTLNMELLGLGYKREGQDVDLAGACLSERPGAGLERRTRRADVIDEDEGFSGDVGAPIFRHDEGIADIAPALVMIEPGLRLGPSPPVQKLRREGLLRRAADMQGQNGRLVVAPPP